MKHLDFKQPVFGSNYLELTIMPLYGLIPAPGFVKIWFTKGGCDKFLRIFDVAKAQVAQQLRQGRMAHDNDFNQRIRNGFFANSNAYQDPNDPTYVYVQQPEATFQNTNQFLGDQQYYNTMHGAPAGQQPPLPPGFTETSNQPQPQPAPQEPKPFAKPTGGDHTQTQTQPHQPTPTPTNQGPFSGQGVSIGNLLN
jgi:hypothetical protein